MVGVYLGRERIRREQMLRRDFGSLYWGLSDTPTRDTISLYWLNRVTLL